MLKCCLYVVFFDELVQITDKNALHRWNKEKLGYLALIILVIIVTYFLESNQIALAKSAISYHQRLRLANR